MNSTKNYDQFKTIPGNRQVNPAHLRNLKMSIQKRNLLASCPILVSENYEVIDGQHRLLAAKELNLEIYYISLLVENNTDLIILTQLLNANLKPWANVDYLNSYLELGYEDYRILDLVYKEHHLPLGLAILYLAEENNYPKSDHANPSLLKQFKDGEFKVKNLKNALTHIEQAKEFIPYLDDKAIWTDKQFVCALRIVNKYANHKRLLEKMRYWRRPLLRRATAVQYIRDMEEIYNFRNTKKIRFYEEIEESEEQKPQSNGVAQAYV